MKWVKDKVRCHHLHPDPHLRWAHCLDHVRQLYQILLKSVKWWSFGFGLHVLTIASFCWHVSTAAVWQWCDSGASYKPDNRLCAMYVHPTLTLWYYMTQILYRHDYNSFYNTCCLDNLAFWLLNTKTKLLSRRRWYIDLYVWVECTWHDCWQGYAWNWPLFAW